MIKLRLLALAAVAALAAILYVFAPPPQGARAFEAQSTWGGTATGSANAITIAISNVQSLNNILGVPIRFNPAFDNTGAVTAIVGNLAATAVKRPSSRGLVDFSGAEFKAGETTSITYNGSVYVLSSNVDMTPIGRTVDFRGAATPRGTLIEDGSCVSQSTYAALFAEIGHDYAFVGSCTPGQFRLPYSNGRAFVALDNQGASVASKITMAGSNCNGTIIGNCGFESSTLLYTQLPANIPNTATSVSSVSGGIFGGITHGLSGTIGGSQDNPVNYGQVLVDTVTTVVINPNGGQPHSTLNPITLGRRAIKY